MQIQLKRKNGDGPIEKMTIEANTPEAAAALEDVLKALQAAQPDTAAVAKAIQPFKPELPKTSSLKRETVAEPPKPATGATNVP